LKEDFEDYITGARILGCGGGGGPGSSMTFFEDALKKGVKFQLIDISEAPKDKRLCTISGVGGGVSREDRERVASYSQRVQRTEEAQIQRWKRIDRDLSDYIGDEIHSYISSETGSGNGIAPMRMNAILGKPIVDGDGCGRAKPEIGISLTHVAGIPIAPIVILTPFNETVIVKTVVDDYRGEDITRHVAVASGGSCTAARCPATVKEYEKGIAKGQITRCIRIGEAIRKAREKGADPVEAFQKATKAYKIFEGKVGSLELEGRGGFNWGNWYLEGEGEFKGKKLRIWVKNENLVSWLDDKPYAMCPDLICVVDAKTSEGLANSGQIGATYAGKKVTVLGIKALDQWRTPKGIEIFGPKHFGFNIEFTPIEELV